MNVALILLYYNLHLSSCGFAQRQHESNWYKRFGFLNLFKDSALPAPYCHIFLPSPIHISSSTFSLSHHLYSLHFFFFFFLLFCLVPPSSSPFSSLPLHRVIISPKKLVAAHSARSHRTQFWEAFYNTSNTHSQFLS